MCSQINGVGARTACPMVRVKWHFIVRILYGKVQKTWTADQIFQFLLFLLGQCTSLRRCRRRVACAAKLPLHLAHSWQKNANVLHAICNLVLSVSVRCKVSYSFNHGGKYSNDLWKPVQDLFMILLLFCRPVGSLAGHEWEASWVEKRT